MKKRRKITDLLDGLNAARSAEPGFEAESIDPEQELTPFIDDEAELARLGEALIKRLNVPEDMALNEAVDAIISLWDNEEANPPQPIPERERMAGREMSMDEPSFEEERLHLPRTLRGGTSEPPEADYESMSAEQFRRLKKQLKRASMDGRRVRL